MFEVQTAPNCPSRLYSCPHSFLHPDVNRLCTPWIPDPSSFIWLQFLLQLSLNTTPSLTTETQKEPFFCIASALHYSWEYQRKRQGPPCDPTTTLKLWGPCLVLTFWTQNILKSLKKWKLLSHVRFFANPWIIHSMDFSRPEYWSG